MASWLAHVCSAPGIPRDGYNGPLLLFAAENECSPEAT
jgi:hypothetical protein